MLIWTENPVATPELLFTDTLYKFLGKPLPVLMPMFYLLMAVPNLLLRPFLAIRASVCSFPESAFEVIDRVA
jgi:hypothetical protein